MECFYDNQSTAEEKRDTKVEENFFFFLFLGRKVTGWPLVSFDLFAFTFMEFLSVRLQVQLLILSSRRRLYHDKIKSRSIKTRYKNVKLLNAVYGSTCQ